MKNNMTKNPWFFVSVGLALIILILIGTSFNGSSGTAKVIDSNNKDIAILSEGAVLGEKDAPVTIIEYSDYECPFCARFYTGAYQQIKEEYIATGKVKLIFKDFPLSFHQNAQKASEAAWCAGDQDKYFEMHDKLFESGVSGGTTTFKKYAKELGLDEKDFNECLDSDKYEDLVQQNFKEGQSVGVSGTPSFTINGKLIVGAQPFEVFKQAIEEELNK